MSDRVGLPDLSASLLERAYPRTSLCFSEQEKMALARSFASLGEANAVLRLPEFLSTRKWARGRGFVADLAALELSLRLAALAPELESSGFEGVASATEPQWYSARFRFDPAHRILESDWPLEEVFAHPQDSHERSPGEFLIFRSGGKAQFRRIERNESLLIRALGLGVTLGKILERPNGPDFDSYTFHRWIESGLLRAIVWAPVKSLDSSTLLNPS